MKYSTQPLVVIQTVTYNNAKTIETCIHSVLRQQYRNILFVVIDNNSTDGTRKILQKNKVKVVSLRRNIGYAAAHNVGLRRFASDYVLTLNPDIVIKPDFVGKLVSAMEAASTSVGSAQALLYRVENLNDRSAMVDSAGLYITRYRRQGLRFAGKIWKTKYAAQKYIFGPDGAAAFYRRSMLVDIDCGNGVFDEDYFMHKEDVDVCWRAQLRGWQSIFVPEAKGYHIRTFRSGKRIHIDTSIRMMAIRNRYYLMIKNDLLALWIRDLPWILAYDIGVLFYILFREWESLPAYGHVFRNFSPLLLKRSRIQRSRKVDMWYMSRWFHGSLV